MRWIIPEKRRDQEIAPRVDRPNDWKLTADFNAPLAENNGGVCLEESRVETIIQADQNEADEDIRKGQVKTFDNPDDLIASLKEPW